MTVVVCLNYGDKLFVVSDSLMSTQDGNKLRPIGYRLKLYPLMNQNAVIGFSGSLKTAQAVLANVMAFAAEHEALTEEELFNRLPDLIVEPVRNWKTDNAYDLDVVYAGLTPGSLAFEEELLPGGGIPPKNFCGVFSLKFEQREIIKLVGAAKQTRSDSESKLFSREASMLMDCFVVGSGARLIEPPQQYLSFKYVPPEFVHRFLPVLLKENFKNIPMEDTGVGGAFQAAMITEDGLDIRVANPVISPNSVSIHVKHGAFFVTDSETREKQIIQTIWDERYPFEFDEYGCLL